MSDIPLIEKEISVEGYIDGILEKNTGKFSNKIENEFFFKSDVVNDLKKFRKGYFGKSVEYFINSTNECCKCKECAYILLYINNKFYCKSCWFKECFGKLPEEEKELSKK